jgi:ferrochelatase
MALQQDFTPCPRAECRSSGWVGPPARAALLINLGTPDGPDARSVQRYLAEFLADPHVVQLPWLLRRFRPALARFIARRRAPLSAEKYRCIWTPDGSPLRVITQNLAAALQHALPGGWRVFAAMRYGQPSIAETLAALAAKQIEQVVAVPLYPQFSHTTTGAAMHELNRVVKRTAPYIRITACSNWCNDAGYIDAQARLVSDYAAQHRLGPADAILLYSAHGLPLAHIARGDPYAAQVSRSVALVTERLGWPAERTRVAYQSRMGPGPWLEPETEAVLAQLAAEGERRVLVCPISFAVDCLETLEEIDLRYEQRFAALGGQLHRCPALNAFPPFVNALKNLVLHGPRSAGKWAGPALLEGACAAPLTLEHPQ